MNLVCRCGWDLVPLYSGPGEFMGTYCSRCQNFVSVSESDRLAERVRRVHSELENFSADAAANQLAALRPSVAAPPWHTPSYDEIVFKNRRFRPTKIQALIFRQLAASHPRPLHRAELTRQITAARRRRDLADGRRRRSARRDTRVRIFFRGKNRGLFGKGKLIVPEGKGFYRLNCTP